MTESRSCVLWFKRPLTTEKEAELAQYCGGGDWREAMRSYGLDFIDDGYERMLVLVANEVERPGPWSTGPPCKPLGRSQLDELLVEGWESERPIPDDMVWEDARLEREIENANREYAAYCKWAGE